MKHAFPRWKRGFKAAARADDYALLLDHMGKLGLLPEPELMMEGTVLVMSAIVAYATIDGRPFEPFLEMQEYDPVQATGARYSLTFDLCGKSYARVLVNSRLETVDLADLFSHPWGDYQATGYSRIWISHTDWSRLTDEEVREVQEEVTADLRFDYSEDEIDFWFEVSPGSHFLLVRVQGIWEEEDDD